MSTVYEVARVRGTRVQFIDPETKRVVFVGHLRPHEDAKMQKAGYRVFSSSGEKVAVRVDGDLVRVVR